MYAHFCVYQLGISAAKLPLKYISESSTGSILFEYDIIITVAIIYQPNSNLNYIEPYMSQLFLNILALKLSDSIEISKKNILDFLRTFYFVI